MKTSKPTHSIPAQHEGVQKDLEESLETKDVKSALAQYREGKRRLLDINNWDKLCGSFSAKFKLTDLYGKGIRRKARTGDHIKISIPAPSPEDEADWVTIEAIDENSDLSGDSEYLSLRVRPTNNPLKTTNEIAHFFSEDATSNFIIQRHHTKIIAGIYGRNEKPNLESSALPVKVRNTIVALGAIIGIADFQWTRLLLGILDKK